MSNYDYYNVEFKLIREQLGTLNEASIIDEHIIKRAMKAIKKANKEGEKLTKALEKYYGSEITEEKRIKEVTNIINTFCELTGYTVDKMPNNMDDLLFLAQKVEGKYKEMVNKGERLKATVFMRMKKKDSPTGTWPIISTHMVLGNLKAIAQVITNNSTLEKESKIFPSKIAVKEALSLDVKAIEPFMIPDRDIRRWSDNSKDMDETPETARRIREEGSDRMLMERPLRFQRGPVEETAIALSEIIPVGTKFGCTLRVRKDSVLSKDVLEYLFDYGKNLGFGQWRGSGNMGAYKFKLKKIKNYNEVDEDGFR